jgi:hypothetical protein
MAYQPRTYRRSVDPKGLSTFEVVVRETDLAISARTDLGAEAMELVVALRVDLEGFVSRHPRFLTSFVPYEVGDDAPAIVADMGRAALLAGVGPMAAVAGAMAEHVARGLARYSDEVIVENGGDCFLLGATERTVAIHAGSSPLSGRIGIAIASEALPLAVCTSSASVGPSVSLGWADAAVAIAANGALADAAATVLGNRVHSDRDVERAMEAAQRIEGVLGLAVIVGETLGAWGAARLVPLE